MSGRGTTLLSSVLEAEPEATRSPLFTVEVQMDLSGWETAKRKQRQPLVDDASTKPGSLVPFSSALSRAPSHTLESDTDDTDSIQHGGAMSALAGIAFKPQPEAFKQVC